MVRIRLRRVGKKKQPSYRVMVADSETAPDARFLESIGFYDPRSEPPTLKIDELRLRFTYVGCMGTSREFYIKDLGEDNDG